MSVTLKLDPLTMTYCLNDAEMVGQGFLFNVIFIKKNLEFVVRI